MTKGEPAQKKKIVGRSLPKMIFPKGTAVQFSTDLLASTLPMAPAQDDIPTQPPSVVGALDMPILSSPEHTAVLPPTSGTGALVETTTAPPSSPTTRLVSLGKILLIIYAYFFLSFCRCSWVLTPFSWGQVIDLTDR